MYLVYEFFSGYLQLLKLQLRLRRSYLHLNLNFRSSHHLHSVYVPLQGMYSWHDNTRKKKTSKLKHFVALYSFDFCCCSCWLIYSSWLRGAITEKPRFFSYQRHLCPVLKFCVWSIFPRDAIHRSQPLLALLQHLQGLKNKKSSSLGVSSTIYVLRWSYSFGSLFLVFWWCRVPNSLAIFPPEIYLRRPHNQNTQNRLYFWTHDCHFFNNVTPFYFKYIYFSDPKVFCLGLIQSLFEGSMYSFVLEWTPALTTGKATYNYRFFMFLSTVKIKRTLLECLCI